MFTGIIETMGTVKEVIINGSNTSFWIESEISASLKPDQSVSHDGVCLTVEEVAENSHKVSAIAETLKKTTLATWQQNRFINLERCLQINSRLDGHFVQGHVDTTGFCTRKKEKNGSWELEFRFPKKFNPFIIEKGSVCLNGISLTCFDVKKESFRVAIIPYTYNHTNLHQLQEGNAVNIEFDLVGKYIVRQLDLKTK
jgi:riboflavin synthase